MADEGDVKRLKKSVAWVLKYDASMALVWLGITTPHDFLSALFGYLFFITGGMILLGLVRDFFRESEE